MQFDGLQRLILRILATPADAHDMHLRMPARVSRDEVSAALRRLAQTGLVRRFAPRGRPTRRYELTWRGALAATQSTRGRRRAGPGRAGLSPVERRRMAERIERCAELSSLAARLRDAAAARP